MNADAVRCTASDRPGRRPSPAGGASAAAWAAVGLLALVLICRTLALIWALARPMPYWDAWEFMKALPAVLDGRYGLAELFAFHNEHRIVTTRLLMIADARYFAASGYLPTAVLTALFPAIGCLLGLVAAGRGLSGAAAAAVTASLMLSLAQSDNYASGFQVQFPLADLSAIASIGLFAAACGSRRPLPLLAGAVLADALAIGSMASGNIAVVALALVALLLRSGAMRSALVAAPALAMTAAYLIGYPKPDTPPSHDLVGITHFAVNYLGSALRGIPGAALWLGAALLAAYAAVLLGMILAWRQRERLDAVLVWLAGIAAFIVAGSVVTAWGRLPLGMETSISSRYAVQSLLLTGCVFLMGWRLAGTAGRGTWTRLILAVACLAVSAVSTLAPRGLDDWRDRVADYDAAGTAFASGVFSDEVVTGVYPLPELVRPALTFMAAHRLGPFSPLYADVYRPPTNALVGQAVGNLPACTASVDGVTHTGAGWLDVVGWAVSPPRPAEDGWVLAFDPAEQLLGFGRQSQRRPDVAADLHVGPARLGFDLGLNLARAAPGALTLALVPEGAAGTACRVGPIDAGPA